MTQTKLTQLSFKRKSQEKSISSCVLCQALLVCVSGPCELPKDELRADRGRVSSILQAEYSQVLELFPISRYKPIPLADAIYRNS